MNFINLETYSSSNIRPNKINCSNMDTNDYDLESDSSDSVFSIGNITDVEDIASQIESSLKCGTSLDTSLLNSPEDVDTTDVEDFNASDNEFNDNEEKNNKVAKFTQPYPELKLSLQEFLQIAQEQLLVGNSMKEKVVYKSGNFLESQLSFGLPNDDLTDCEEYGSLSECDDYYQKSAVFDINEAFIEQGRVNIADATSEGGDNDDDSNSSCDSISDDEFDSVSTDPSGQSISIMSDAYKINLREDSPEIDMPKASLNDNNCTDTESDITENSHLEGSFNNLNIFSKDETSVQTNSNNNNNLQRTNDEDNLSITDCEDILCDEATIDTVDMTPKENEEEKEEVINNIKIWLAPQRAIISFHEDKQGNTIADVMPLNSDYQLGLNTLIKDDCITDTEDYSIANDNDFTFHAKGDNTINISDVMEGEIVTETEFMKLGKTNRPNSQTNLDSVTDTEDLNITVPNRRRRKMVKCREANIEKVHRAGANEDPYHADSVTDLEDMDISDCDLNIQNNENVDQRKLCSYSDAAMPKFIQNSDNENYTELTDQYVNIFKPLINDKTLLANVETSNSVRKEIHEMLNESYTMVYEKCSNNFNIDAEVLHIKTPNCETNTDTEYIESDDSVISKAANDH